MQNTPPPDNNQPERDLNPQGPVEQPQPRRYHPLEAPERPPEPQQPSEQPRRPRAILQFPNMVQPRMTYGLIAINVVIFVVGYFLIDGLHEEFVNMGSNYAPRILQSGEYYRLFTAMFLHANPIHIFFNSYVLYIVGMLVERVFGHTRFLLIYFLGGLGGSVLSVLLGNYNVPSIGASGAVFAIWGAAMLHLYWHRPLYGEGARRQLRSLAMWGLFNLAFGLISPGIDNWGHIGGFIGGIAMAWAVGPFFVPTGQQDLFNGIPRIHLKDARPLNNHIWLIGVYLTVVLGVLLVAVLLSGG